MLLTTLKFTSKGRAPCACGAGGRRIHGGVVARIPLIWVDPRTAVRAWCMPGDPNCRNPPWTGNTVACKFKGGEVSSPTHPAHPDCASFQV